MANERKKPKRTMQEDWILPSMEEIEKGGDDQDADLRKRMLKYAKRHPERFEGRKPVSAARSLYASLVSSYMSMAQATGRCPSARDLLDMPVVDMRRTIYDGSLTGGAQDYFDQVSHEVRMSPPMDGVRDFILTGIGRDGDGDDPDEPMILVQALDPPRADPDGACLRSVRLTRFYMSQDMGLHPCMAAKATTMARDHSLELEPDPEGGEPYYDGISLDREESRGLVDYLGAIKPYELDWAMEEIEFWQEVVLPHAAHDYLVAYRRGTDALMAKLYATSANMLAWAMSHHEPEEAEDTSEAARKRASRPRYLKPDPDADTRRLWNVGPIGYRAHEPPRLAAGFPDLRDEAAGKEEDDGEAQEEAQS